MSALASLDVIVLDDHRMVGQAIAGVISEIAGLNVCGVCSSLAEACALIRERAPRLLVLDVNLGGENYGEVVDLLRQLKPEAELLFEIGRAHV